MAEEFFDYELGKKLKEDADKALTVGKAQLDSDKLLAKDTIVKRKPEVYP